MSFACCEQCCHFWHGYCCIMSFQRNKSHVLVQGSLITVLLGMGTKIWGIMDSEQVKFCCVWGVWLGMFSASTARNSVHWEKRLYSEDLDCVGSGGGKVKDPVL